MKRIINYFKKNPIVIICILTFMINAICTVFMKAPVFTDENGTMANAAFIGNVYNWSEAYSSSVTMYWGYGYGILWIPLFYIFRDPFIIYKWIGVINAFIVALIPLLAYNFLKQNFKHISKEKSLFIAFVIGFHPTSYVFAKHAWNEPMLLLLQWLVLYLYFKCRQIYNFKNVFWSFILGLVCAYACTVHERGIIFFAVIIFTEIFMLALTKKKNISYMSFGASFFIGYKLHSLFKSILVSDLIVSDTARNTAESLISKELISAICDLQNLKQILIGMVSQMYYIVFSSFGILIVSIISFFVLMYFWFKKERNDLTKSLLTLSIYTNALFAATLIISTVFYYKSYITNTARGLEYYFYGRYNESCLSIILLLGIIFVLSIKPQLCKIIWAISNIGMAFFAMMILVFLKLKIFHIVTHMFNEINMYFLLPFASDDVVQNASLNDFKFISCILIFISIIMWICFFKNKNKILIGILCMVFATICINHTANYLIPRNDAQFEKVEKLRSYLNNNIEILNGIEQVYLTNVSTRTLTMQFVFPDYQVRFLNTKTYGYDQLKFIKNNSLIISMHNEEFENWVNGFEFIDEVDGYYFWKYSDLNSEAINVNSTTKRDLKDAYLNEHNQYSIVVNDYQSGSAIIPDKSCISTQTCVFMNDGRLRFINRTFLPHTYELYFTGSLLEDLNIEVFNNDGRLANFEILSEEYTDESAKIIIKIKEEIKNGEIFAKKTKSHPYSTFTSLKIMPIG